MSSQLSAGDHRAHRDHQDRLQAMPDFAAAAQILDCSEVLYQALDRHDLPLHQESRSSCVKPGQAGEISCVSPAFPDRKHLLQDGADDRRLSLLSATEHALQDLTEKTAHVCLFPNLIRLQ